MSYTIFGATGYWYGLCVGGSALAYLCVAGVLGYRKRLPSGTVRVYGLLGILLGLLVSRVAFCAANLSGFVDDPASALRFWNGGYSMVGMLCGLVLAAFLTARLCNVRFGTMLDVAAVPMGVLLIGMRLAERFTTLGVGKQVEAGALSGSWLLLSETMGVLTISRLAAYRYEALAALAILLVMLLLFPWRKPLRKNRPGDLAMIFFALYGAVQVLLESMRDDGHMVMGFLRAEQLGAVLMPLLTLMIFTLRWQHIRGGRWQVGLAWLLVPVAGIVICMMLRPINHVLDLTGHTAVGWSILGAIALYMAFFLRVKGANAPMILLWLVVIGAVVSCVMLEFSMDGSDSLLRDYALMGGCCAVLFAAPCLVWRKLQNGVYSEERIAVRIEEKA